MAPTAQLKGVIRLQQGSKVQVHGLEKRPELNGLTGECLQFDASKLRWGVQLPDGAKILLKMANLRPVEAEVSAVAAAEVPAAPVLGAASSLGAAAADAGGGPADAHSVAAAASGAGAGADAAAASGDAAGAAGDAASPAEDAGPGAGGGGEAAASKDAGEAAREGGGEEEAFPELASLMPQGKAPPRTGRWWQNESAAAGFAERLRANDPTLEALCLVPPKRFAEEDAEAISSGLEGNTFCRELLASGHSLSAASCERLSRALRRNGSLRTLSLGDSSLGDLAAVLFEGLAENSSITSLDLEHKGLTTDAGKKLASALARRHALGAPALDLLQLSRNPPLATALPDLAASEAPAPRRLVLCEGGLVGDRDGPALGRWLARGAEELDLRGNSAFASDGLEALLAALLGAGAGASAPALRRLRLADCAVGDEGAEALAAAARKGLALEELSLDACEVTPVGCEALARALAGRGRLARLSLRANLVGDEGCLAVAGLAENMDLSAADLGPRGLEALAKQPHIDALELFNSPKLGASVGEWCAGMTASDWPQLSQLDMSCCALGNEGFKALCTKLLDPDIMPKLKVLSLGGNDVDDSEEAESHDLSDKLSEARGIRVIWRNG